MALIQAKEPKKNVNLRTAQLVQLLAEIGPDIPEISRRLGQFKESVRYRYKEKILNRGMVVQAVADHERLGLKRVIGVVEFSPEFNTYAPTILTAMSDLCYVTSFAKTLPGSRFVVEASVPYEHIKTFVDFMGLMKEKGLFTFVDVMPYDWMRWSPMKADYYDFDSGQWDFDWTNSSPGNYQAALYAYSPSMKTKFDYVDLMIIKELQKDANISLKEISDKLSINYKKLAWHYGTHVLANRMIDSYRINWMGTAYNFESEKAMHRKHRYVSINLFVKNVTNVERLTLMQNVNQLPFVWAEASGTNYFADLSFPVENVTEALEYIEKIIAPVRDRAEFFIMDVTNSLSFVIGYKLFNQESKQWTFNMNELTERFENLIAKIREGVS